MSHARRRELESRFPVHVTVKLRQGLGSLRHAAAYEMLRLAFVEGCERRGFRLVHYSVLSNHIHLLVEAEDRPSLSRGLQGLLVRIARGLNIVVETRSAISDVYLCVRPVLSIEDPAWMHGSVNACGQRAARSFSGDDPYEAIEHARRRLPHLCGRDPAYLDAEGLARATVESVAENTSDAVVAPLFWGAVAGVPGLVGYRAVNTLDAMVGHKSERHRNFGWASARLVTRPASRRIRR